MWHIVRNLNPRGIKIRWQESEVYAHHLTGWTFWELLFFILSAIMNFNVTSDKWHIVHGGFKIRWQKYEVYASCWLKILSIPFLSANMNFNVTSDMWRIVCNPGGIKIRWQKSEVYASCWLKILRSRLLFFYLPIWTLEIKKLEITHWSPPFFLENSLSLESFVQR